jgi:hypothetical protein
MVKCPGSYQQGSYIVLGHYYNIERVTQAIVYHVIKCPGQYRYSIEMVLGYYTLLPQSPRPLYTI